jgi:hypothetical protein
MPNKGHTFGAVWRYEGPRGVVWRIRYRDRSGRRVMETLGTEPEWNRTRARAELKRRQVDVERAGYQRPDVIRFDQFARDWLVDYLPAGARERKQMNSMTNAPGLGSRMIRTHP